MNRYGTHVKRIENRSSFFPQGCAARWDANSQEWIGMILLGIGLAQRAGRPENEAISYLKTNT